MKEHNQQLENIFHTVSRYIVLAPVVLIVMALFLKLNSNNSSQLGYREYVLTPTPRLVQNNLGKLNTTKPSSPAAKFNLQGPLICSFTTEENNIQAYVKDKKMVIRKEEKNIQKNYLLNGDCVYMWQEGVYTGEKICGVSQQVSLVDGLLSSGLLSPDIIFNNLSKVLNIPQANNSEDVLKSALTSCKNESIPKTVRFDVPKNVLYKNSSLE